MTSAAENVPRSRLRRRPARHGAPSRGLWGPQGRLRGSGRAHGAKAEAPGSTRVDGRLGGSATAQAASRKRARLVNRLIPLLLVLIGVGVFVYPVVATQYNNTKQREFAQQYNKEVATVPSAELAKQLEEARAYNKTLTGVPILDPWLDKVAADPKSEAYRAYMSQLDGYSAMARIRAPELGIDLPIQHGTSDATLAAGAGHLYGTSLPVGGESTHAVITSHTGMANATLFDHLHEAKLGDLFLVDVLGETLAYEVDQIKVVLPSEISDLTTVKGDDYLTLFTCTPYAVNSHRLLVRAHRVPYTAEQAKVAEKPAPTFVMETWMWWLLAGAAAGLVALAVILLGMWRSRRRKKTRLARLDASRE